MWCSFVISLIVSVWSFILIIRLPYIEYWYLNYIFMDIIHHDVSRDASFESTFCHCVSQKIYTTPFLWYLIFLVYHVVNRSIVQTYVIIMRVRYMLVITVVLK